MFKKYLAVVGIFGLLASHVFAQDAPTITIRKGDRVPVALSGLGGASGPAITKILQNDLDLSGWFQLVPDSRGSYVISGSASSGSLQGRVTDASGAVVLSKSYTGDDRLVAHQFADDIVETLTGNQGIATTKIAFVGTGSGPKEIYLADYDGSNARRLTSDRGISVAPSLGPGARTLAYTGYQSGYPDVYVIDLASGSRQRVVSAPGTNSGADISPDGGRMALTMSKDGNPEIYVTGLHGGGAKRLTRTKGVESAPTWSPDGREIIFSSDDGGSLQLYRMSASGGTPQRLNTGFAYSTDPSWSPDGKRVAFTVRSGGGFSVALMDLNGGGGNIIAAGQNPVWARDSRHLIYSTGSSLNLLDVHTGRTTTIVSGLGKVSEPTWSH